MEAELAGKDRSGMLSHLGVTNVFKLKKEGFTSIIDDESCFTWSKTVALWKKVRCVKAFIFCLLLELLETVK